MSESVDSCTYETISCSGLLFGFKKEFKIEVIDTPGLEDTQARDSEHILNMVKFLKKLKSGVNQFVLTING